MTKLALVLGEKHVRYRGMNRLERAFKLEVFVSVFEFYLTSLGIIFSSPVAFTHTQAYSSSVS